jgi:hypothetical protein
MKLFFWDVMSCDLGNSNNVLEKPAALKISENCVSKFYTQEILDNVHHPRLKIQSFRGSICHCLHTDCRRGRTYRDRPTSKN